MRFCYYYYWVLFSLTKSIIISKKATREYLSNAETWYNKLRWGLPWGEEEDAGGRGRRGTSAPLQHPSASPTLEGGTHASLDFLPLFGERHRRNSVVYYNWALKAWEAHFVQCYAWRNLHSLLTHEAKLFKYHSYVNIYISKKKNFL